MASVRFESLEEAQAKTSSEGAKWRLEKEHLASESLPLAGGKKGPQVESVASGVPAAVELNLAQALRTVEFWLLFACFSAWREPPSSLWE